MAALVTSLGIGNCDLGTTVASGGYMRLDGSDKNGRTLQGPELERREVRTNMPLRNWLHGQRLVGTMAPNGKKVGNTVAIADFRGDHVVVHERHGTGWSRQPWTINAEQLVGLHWSETHCPTRDNCIQVHFRITQVAVDRSRNAMIAHGSNRDIRLYTVEVATDASLPESGWDNVCGTGGVGIFVNGQWSGPGQRSGAWSETGYTFSCTTGTVAKCVRSWGYKPWQLLPTPSGKIVDLQPLHQACVRALRADYCGDGTSHTREGTPIALADTYRFNVNTHGGNDTLESGFSKDGAVWMRRARWPTASVGKPNWAGRTRLCRQSAARAASDATPRIIVWSAPGTSSDAGAE